MNEKYIKDLHLIFYCCYVRCGRMNETRNAHREWDRQIESACCCVKNQILNLIAIVFRCRSIKQTATSTFVMPNRSHCPFWHYHITAAAAAASTAVTTTTTLKHKTCTNIKKKSCLFYEITECIALCQKQIINFWLVELNALRCLSFFALMTSYRFIFHKIKQQNDFTNQVNSSVDEEMNFSLRQKIKSVSSAVLHASQIFPLNSMIF